MKISKEIIYRPNGMNSRIYAIWSAVTREELQAFKNYVDLLDVEVEWGGFFYAEYDLLKQTKGFPLLKEELLILEDFLALYD